MVNGGVDEFDRLAVVDVETTGFGNVDRVVEVAVVTLSRSGEIIDEWDTLVNPERDVGRTDIHRVTASMVTAAPTFSEISVALAERIDGAVLVAHNLPFDSRMLVNEYDRSGASLDPGVGLCTYRMTGESLSNACRNRGVPLDGAHRALSDARATALLLGQLVRAPRGEDAIPAIVDVGISEFSPRTLRRDMIQGSDENMPYLARLAGQARHRGERGAAVIYMEFLDWVLADFRITVDEQDALLELAIEVGLPDDAIAETHARYLDELIVAAMRDGVVDSSERALLERAARELGVDPAVALVRLELPSSGAGWFVLEEGTRACFTGSATYPDGSELPRSVLETTAEELGVQSVKNVTKKGCDLLVAADPMSQSGKTRKARDYGVPIVSVHEFLRAQTGAVLGTS